MAKRNTSTSTGSAAQTRKAIWSNLQQSIVDCEACPRLIKHCQKIAETKRKAYLDDAYWGRPVANFGKQSVPLLVVGLAPGAHGANRTGRMFTGDRSGDWLYRAMHKAGFANQPESTAIDDGLKLKRSTITGICHCAPPDNKPTPEEVRNCRPFLDATIESCRPRVFLALGRLAWIGVVRYAIENKWLASPQPKFAHGHLVQLQADSKRIRKTRWLIGCFHPSQQNTFTGRLTEPMIDEIFSRINKLLDDD